MKKEIITLTYGILCVVSGIFSYLYKEYYLLVILALLIGFSAHPIGKLITETR